MTGLDLSEPSLALARETAAAEGLDVERVLAAYTLPELRTMLFRAGLETESAWSGWDGREYGIEGSRLIFHARGSA